MSEERPTLTCYGLLQVHPAAPLDLITSAYWCLAETIQRRRASQADAGEQLHLLTSAYETLSRAEARAAYDARIGLGPQGPLPSATRPRRRRGLFSRGGNGGTPVPDHGVDYYEVLRVDREASAEVLELAFATMRDYYLRAVTVSAAPPELMDLLSEAHAVTSDPELRSKYDERLARRRRSPVPDNGGPPADPPAAGPPKDAGRPGDAAADPSRPAEEPPAGARRSESRGHVRRLLKAGLALAGRGCWNLLALAARAVRWAAVRARRGASAAVNAALERLSERLIDYRAQHGTSPEAEEAVLERLSHLTPDEPGHEAPAPGADNAERA